MFRLPISILRGSSYNPPMRRQVVFGKVLPMRARPATNDWVEPTKHLEPRPMRVYRKAESLACEQTPEPSDIRRFLTETDRSFKVSGRVLSKFVTLVLDDNDGYDRYLKREATRLRTCGKPWSRMTAKELRDEARHTLTADLCQRMRSDRAAWFVRPSYRGNPVRVYCDAHNREFCFVIAEDRPEVIGIFPMNRFLNTDRQRSARRRVMLKPGPRIAS